MSTSPYKEFTPKKRNLSKNTTRSLLNQFSTPKTNPTLINNIDTPECFTNVLVETPKVIKNPQKDACSDEEFNLRVAVRIRPMNAAELTVSGCEDVVRVKDKQIIVCPSKYNHQNFGIDHTFTYDHVFWSVDDLNSSYANQEDVFMTIGVPLLNSAFKGFNACLFAYGQTGSGKSYSMMGKNITNISDINSDEFSGITPRFCREVFKRVTEIEQETTVSIDVSYYEIYNEKIHDLLACTNTVINNTPQIIRVPLKVREHPTMGPYIVNLTTHSVKNYSELCNFLIIGNRNRAIASTAMNDASSRSHSIFCIELGQSKTLNDTDNTKRSRISLVDLAGSERLGNYSTNNDEKIKQGVSINKSLLTLGKCISALAEKKKNLFIPYRDSVLTWLLRESLGGNSLTSMLATISPSSTHLEETLSTLRYACQARAIVNRARINESPHDRLIRELRSEVDRLEALRKDYEKRISSSSPRHSSSFNNDCSNNNNSSEIEEVKSKLNETQQRLLDAQEIWQQRFMESRQNQLKELAEAEQYKAELESKVRILRTINEDVKLSPYKTNFLKELEGVLTTNNDDNNAESLEDYEIIEDIKSWCNENGFICTLNSDTLKIVDVNRKKYVLLALNNLHHLQGFENIKDFLNNLHWQYNNNNNKGVNKNDVVASMNEIYQILGNLQPPEADNSLSLLYAKVNKTLQKYETALVNSLSQPKTVTFNLDKN